MLKNYFITAWRSLRSRPLFAFINITGLTLGLAFAGAIGIYVFENFRVDRTQPDKVYRVITAYQTATVNGQFPTVGRALLPAIEAEIPEVQYVVPMYKAYFPLTKESEHYFDDILFAGEHFFDVLNFPLLYGDRQTALSAPYTAVLTKSMAQKYFGNTNVIGKTMMVQDSIPCTVTGVLDDLPASHINFDVLLSFATWQRMQGDMSQWFTWDMTCYVSLRDGADAATAEQKISALSMAHNGDEFRSNGYDVSHQLEAVRDIYLHSSLSGLNVPAGNLTQLYILSAIGLSLLILACINFINLTTALLADRAKEVGVRKTLGATAGGLTGQFMIETLVMVFLASFLAAGLVLVLLPVISQLSNQPISYDILLSPPVMAGWLLLMGITTLFAGGYPAFILSKLQPASAIKNNSSSPRNGFSLRRLLVIFQFTVTLVLITGTFIGIKQLDYMRHKELGFHKEHVAVISLAKSPFETVIENYESVKHELTQLPGVKSVTAAAGLPGRSGWNGQLVNAEGFSQDKSFTMEVIPADQDYVKTLGIRMAAGRDFSAAHTTDATEGVLINEAACRRIGWQPEEAIGKWITTPGMEQGRIIGVMSDYHQHGLQQAVNPIVVFKHEHAYNYIAVATQGDHLKSTMEAVEQLWKTRFPGYPFESFMLDDDFDRQYRTETNMANTVGIFALLTIFVACLGLVGLTTYTVTQKRKEIGVRKVLGASVIGLVGMLSSTFIRLVILSAVIATPITWWAMSTWLEGFAYRIDIQWWMFALAGLSAVVIALATVSWQTIRAAVANPVDSLRDE